MGGKYCKAKVEGDFCDDVCKKKYDDYFEFENRTKYWFLLGFLVGMILIVGGAYVSFKLLSPIGLFIIGGTVTALPLMTGWDVKYLGVKNSLIIIRVLGILVMIGAAIWAVARVI